MTDYWTSLLIWVVVVNILLGIFKKEIDRDPDWVMFIVILWPLTAPVIGLYLLGTWIRSKV